MYDQLYLVSTLSLVMGVLIYSVVSYRLSQDINRGSIPTRLEEKPVKAVAAR